MVEWRRGSLIDKAHSRAEKLADGARRQWVLACGPGVLLMRG
eukprot:CAMPEP_0170183554 /NCGR_PEP_ID=MMETSP0040_2-20121228/31081_1 /TAXON_ID=641309 /ORGANISM="Lotharella oceanica, Strain CCMP622" /LENGTH=41 /DNA_ID= /DNA_START= /DNA_END= /DNA_ORIENTATION=